MPTYEYQCTRCGQLTSEFKPMSAPRRQRCPACRGKVELQISGGLGVVFKGDGFYINDSRKAAGARAAKPAGDMKGDTAPGANASANTGADTGAPAPATVHDSGSGAKDKQ
ncbi:MAG: zinc ribbon domain-containing protein [bacterium]|nr:zinc ribbon domain-containing protein [bacterium]